MTMIASLHGCGSAPDSIRDRATPEESGSEEASTERAANVVGLVLQSEGQEPVSALEIANAPVKAFSRDEVSGAWIVSFADLNLKTALNLESITEEDVKRFPDWLKSLHGTKIRIRGYMYPTFEETGIESFCLGSPRTTNFGIDPKVYELMQVHLAAGTTTDYVGNFQSIEVIGTFRIEPFIEEGTMYALYVMKDAVIVADKSVPK